MNRNITLCENHCNLPFSLLSLFSLADKIGNNLLKSLEEMLIRQVSIKQFKVNLLGYCHLRVNFVCTACDYISVDADNLMENKWHF